MKASASSAASVTNVGATIARNSAWLLGSEFISRILLFVVVVWLANYLGATQYGQLSYALAISNIIVVIADFGLNTYLIRDLARDKEKTQAYLAELLGLKTILTGIAFIVLLIAGLVLSNLRPVVLLFGGAAILLNNFRMFLEAFFRSHQRMHLEARTKIAAGCILAATIAAGILWEQSLVVIATGYAVAAVLGVLWTMWVLRHIVTHVTVRYEWNRFRTILIAASPFALSLACNVLFNYLDSTIMGWLGQTEQVGWYNAVYKPVFFITTIAGLIISAFFPVISRQYAHERERVGITVQHLVRLQVMIAIPLAIGGVLLARPIVKFLFVDEFLNGVLAFQLLLCGTAVIYVWAAFGNSLQACDQQRLYLRGFLWGAVVNVLLNAVLIPRFSLNGAAVATLLTQVFLLVWMVWHFRAIADVRLFAVVWRPLFAAVGMGMVVYWLHALPVLALLPLGIAAYAALLFALRGLNTSDVQFLRSVWKKRT